MAKDLRGLLEPATASNSGNGPQTSAPLAQRRSLSSPGEPRVFRVRSGFVCGLCGRLHTGLEKAFDCLGRCTIELRLRAPAGPTHLGGQAHFACTACGRGFVNSDDAEQCFERCLGRMKPNPQFEKALRRVQVRYAQRLASHGVRALERIDPLTEHTKMLTTLTKERAALGRDTTVSPPRQQPSSSKHHTQQEPHTAVEQVLRTDLHAEQELSQLSEETLIAPIYENEGAEFENHAIEDRENTEPAAIDENASTAAAEAMSGEHAHHESAMATEVSSSASAASQFEEDMPSLEEFDSNSNPESFNHDSALQADSTEAAHMSESSVNELVNADELDAVAQIDLESIDSPQPEFDTSSALSALASATPESQNTLPQRDTAKVSNASQLNPNIADTLSALGADDLGSAFAEASEFASVATQPEEEGSGFASMEVQTSDVASMGADVLALLQAPPEGENLKLNANQEKILKDKTIQIDEALLDAVTSSKEIPIEVAEIFVRKADMKPYRRNNAKYGCSACTREFFTKEQVEACFYSHPEEGSEEEKVLREKIAKNKANSAA